MSASRRLPRKCSNAAMAISASGDGRPGRAARTAPEPIRSSMAGRSEPSGQRSPAGITAMREPCLRAQSATARQLRRQAVNVAAVQLACIASVLPFGEGITRVAPVGIDCRALGDRGDVPASLEAFQWRGRTEAPCDNATSTAVENRSTSTMMTTSLTGASRWTPASPQAQRRSYSD